MLARTALRLTLRTSAVWVPPVLLGLFAAALNLI